MDRSRVRLYQSPGHTSMATEFPVTKQHKPLTFPQTHPPHFVFIYLFIYFQKNKQTNRKKKSPFISHAEICVAIQNLKCHTTYEGNKKSTERGADR